MLEQFRSLWEKLMSPPARLFVALGVHPDVVTWTGTVMATIIALVMLPQGWLWQGAALLLVFVLSDGVDGRMARMQGSTSTWGAFLDSSLDRVTDGAVFGGVVLYYAGPGDSVLWAGIAVGALVMGQVTSYVKARGEALGMTVVGGLAARADRLLVILVGLALTGAGLAWALPVALSWLLLASTITVGQRMAQVKSQAPQHDVDR